MAFVSDSGPILSFARAQRLEVLREVVGELLIPRAVYSDIVVAGRGRPGSTAVSAAEWIRLVEAGDRSLINRLPSKLHLGEREAIALANELRLVLLVDEREARKAAASLGIPYFGSLRILKEAKDRRIVVAIRPILDELIASGTYVARALYKEVLRQVGEK